MVKQTNTKTPTHHIRTLISALLGAAGVGLLLMSILVVWVNRTLTDTKTFTSTVSPLVTNSDIQNFVAAKVSDGIIKDAPPQEVAAKLLPADQIAGKTDEQLQAALRPVINNKVIDVIGKPSFKALWADTTQSAHQQLMTQLKSDSPVLTLDFGPAITGVINELKQQPDLAEFSDKIELRPDQGKLDLKGGGIEKAHDAYKAFQASTIGIVVLALILIAASVAISVHHLKTLRRALFLTGFGALILALILQAPSLVKLTDNPVDAAAAKALAKILFHNLQLASIIIAVVCLTAAISSKIYSLVQSRSKKA